MDSISTLKMIARTPAKAAGPMIEMFGKIARIRPKMTEMTEAANGQPHPEQRYGGASWTRR